MRQLIIGALLSCLSVALFSQNQRIPLKFYVKNLNAYEGVWSYESNDTVFTLKLVKFEANATNRFEAFEQIGGLYSISIGGIEIESTMSRLSDFLAAPNNTRVQYRVFRLIADNVEQEIQKVNPNILKLKIRLPRMSYGQKILEFVVAKSTITLLAPDKIEWKVAPDTVSDVISSLPQGNPPSWAFPLPAYAILKKVKE